MSPKSIFQVNFPPHVKLSVDRQAVKEGEMVRFVCDAEANPAPMTFAWFLGGRRVAEAPESSNELVIESVDRRLHNHLVRCEVKNSIGRKEESVLMNVMCK